MENLVQLKNYALVFLASSTLMIDQKIAISSFVGIIIGYILNDFIRYYKEK